MEIESLNEFIKKSLIHYDNQNMKYLPILKLDNQNIKYNLLDTEITFIYDDDKEQTFDFDVLGYFDNQNHIWIWGWLLTNLSAD